MYRVRRWLTALRLGESRSMPVDGLVNPEQGATGATMKAEFRRFIDEELTEKQSTALLAAMNGMPLEVVADRMGNQPQRAPQGPLRRPQEAQAEDGRRGPLAPSRSRLTASDLAGASGARSDATRRPNCSTKTYSKRS